MKICKYKKCEVCTNADSEQKADFPSSEYCSKCKLYESGDKEDELDHLRYLLDILAIAEMRKWKTAHVDNYGCIDFAEEELKEANMAGVIYSKALSNYKEEYVYED